MHLLETEFMQSFSNSAKPSDGSKNSQPYAMLSRILSFLFLYPVELPLVPCDRWLC